MTGPLIALTGATGFIGRHLLKVLPQQGYRIRVLLRRPAEVPPGASSAVIGDIAAPRNMADALRGVDAIIHSAGIAHAMSGRPEDDYRSINTQGTLALAQAAEKARVKRFVFLSSIRAQSGPSADHVLSETDIPKPTDAYGRSKLAAEEGLASLEIDWVALRPVLVYGPGMRGNMEALLRLARSPWPLPFGSLRGRRSLLGVDDLASALEFTLKTPKSFRRPLIVAQPEALSVAEIVAALRAGFKRGPGIVPLPASFIEAALKVMKRSEMFERLAGSLEASPAELMRAGWQPGAPVREGLARLTREMARDA